VAPLERNAGTCWGKNTIDPSGRGIEKPCKATLTFNTTTTTTTITTNYYHHYYNYYHYYYYYYHHH
jgi:hypothetical protein